MKFSIFNAFELCFTFSFFSSRKALLFLLLAFKCRQPGLHIRPRLLTLDHPANRPDDILLARSDLLRAVSVTEGKGVVLNRLKVDRDAKGDTELVVAGVALSDADAGLVELVADVLVVELGSELLDQWCETGVALERGDEDFDWCD